MRARRSARICADCRCSSAVSVRRLDLLSSDRSSRFVECSRLRRRSRQARCAQKGRQVLGEAGARAGYERSRSVTSRRRRASRPPRADGGSALPATR
jgi:hypothetical protein